MSEALNQKKRIHLKLSGDPLMIMVRDDISDMLVHLTKGTGKDIIKHREEAVITLGSILDDQALKGNIGKIKGGRNCVCFSEAPISKLSYLIASKMHKTFKYQPYGVIVKKRWLYEKGGRPVIYGPEEDYDKLPEEMKHRHVRFELSKDSTIDFTWEREWRVKTDSLKITPKNVTIVTPDRSAMSVFQEKYKQWHFIALSDLGFEIEALKNI